jgi:hypothetical protein
MKRGEGDGWFVDSFECRPRRRDGMVAYAAAMPTRTSRLDGSVNFMVTLGYVQYCEVLEK